MTTVGNSSSANLSRPFDSDRRAHLRPGRGESAESRQDAFSETLARSNSTASIEPRFSLAAFAPKLMNSLGSANDDMAAKAQPVHPDQVGAEQNGKDTRRSFTYELDGETFIIEAQYVGRISEVQRNASK
ncbi:hypothetical protein [Rhizobium sp. CC-YZS058]|uniref:hypothetical protein n=1 Tax=Rhizobium sp. CC-YZS058 TaxID=3042153 RepID=UPI002B05FD54|nr:hypothetical protein [Rhizobium sp. CC-YZS058]MEA3535520.1 hypothetical protein [Rhizobium sp. CC-YZS058]